MAYMRDHFYIWGDGEGIHFHHGWDCSGYDDCPRTEDSETSYVWLPEKIVEEFVVMKAARMIDAGTFEAAVRRAAEKFGGANIGADALSESLGIPSVMDAIEAAVANVKKEID